MSLFSWLGNLFSSKPAKPKEAELGRNDLCWCGSGKKYKKCHLDKDEKDRFEEAYAARVAASKQGRAGGRRPTAAPQRPAEKAEGRGR